MKKVTTFVFLLGFFFTGVALAGEMQDDNSNSGNDTSNSNNGSGKHLHREGELHSPMTDPKISAGYSLLFQGQNAALRHGLKVTIEQPILWIFAMGVDVNAYFANPEPDTLNTWLDLDLLLKLQVPLAYFGLYLAVPIGATLDLTATDGNGTQVTGYGGNVSALGGINIFFGNHFGLFTELGLSDHFIAKRQPLAPGGLVNSFTGNFNVGINVAW
jgi:hypothetical protein